MDLRRPDSYKMETLVETNSPNFSQNLSQDNDISCHELELAMLESLEEAWTKENECASLLSSFQPFLEHLKRVGYYDSEFLKIHDILSVLLYKYSYQIEYSLSEETLQWIEKHLKTMRISPMEQERLNKAFHPFRFTEQSSNHLRYGL